MGLLSTGIKAGAVLGIAHYGMKEYNKHKGQHQQNRPQGPPPPPQASTRDINGYAHQTWCSGQCGGQCNGSGYAHQPFCNGQCGCQCNGDQSNFAIRAVDSQTHFIPPPADEKPPKY